MANYLTGSQRYNNRMSKIMTDVRAIESKRLTEGHAPNPTGKKVAERFRKDIKSRALEGSKNKYKITHSRILEK